MTVPQTDTGGQEEYSKALQRFTVLFEMGRGGSTALWPPDKVKLVCLRFGLRVYQKGRFFQLDAWVIYGQAARAISTP